MHDFPDIDQAALVIEMIDACDRALEGLGGDGANAVRVIRDLAIARLAEGGLRSDMPAGEVFDPHRHEAIASEDGPDRDRIIRVARRGWWQGQALVRPAQVVVMIPGDGPATEVATPDDDAVMLRGFAPREGEPRRRRREM